MTRRSGVALGAKAEQVLEWSTSEHIIKIGLRQTILGAKNHPFWPKWIFQKITRLLCDFFLFSTFFCPVADQGRGKVLGASGRAKMATLIFWRAAVGGFWREARGFARFGQNGQ